MRISTGHYARHTFLWVILSFLQTTPLLAQQTIEFDKAIVFDEVSSLVEKNFLAEFEDSAKWSAQVSEFRSRAIVAKTHDEFSENVNGLLASLNTSHTYYYSRLNPKRYQLLGVFGNLYDADPQDLFIYEGIGIDTRTIDEKTLVSSVYDGLPAAVAGIRFGDQVVAVDGKPFHPILSFRGRAGQIAEVQIERGSASMIINVPVEKLDGRTMFETALSSSIKVIEKNGRRIGYVHAWSYAGTKYQDLLRGSLLWGDLSKCDALVLDIRDGWGGADINYLSLFRDPIAVVESKPRTGAGMSYSGVWERPVALLTNGRSTSGKELFTYGFRKLKLGKVFGESTAGAVVAGRAFLLSNGDVLYLAVSDVKVDGNRLEGVGVEPDIRVPRSLEAATPGDSQLEAAVDFLSK